MLQLQMEDGSVRDIKAKHVNFDEIGVRFYNLEIKCPECVTYDLISKIRYECDVDDSMKVQSKKIQFRESDRPRPGRHTGTGLVG